MTGRVEGFVQTMKEVVAEVEESRAAKSQLARLDAIILELSKGAVE